MLSQVKIKTVTANGQDFHYIEQGSGEGVIFVHGSMGDYRAWQPQLEAFSQEFRAVAYSRRYHYPNEWNGNGRDYSVGLHADDLIALIHALNLAPAHVVGNSFGAYTTLMAATRRPELFKKIVIGEPPILPWLKDIPGGQAYYDGFMNHAWLPAKKAFQANNPEQALRLFVDGISSPGGYDQLPEFVRAKFMENARSLEAETLSPDYFTELTPQQVGSIPVPMLLLTGERSPKMFHLVIERLAESAPQAQLTTIPNASHSMPSGNPQAYNRVVMDFLASPNSSTVKV